MTSRKTAAKETSNPADESLSNGQVLKNPTELSGETEIYPIDIIIFRLNILEVKRFGKWWEESHLQ